MQISKAMGPNPRFSGKWHFRSSWVNKDTIQSLTGKEPQPAHQGRFWLLEVPDEEDIAIAAKMRHLSFAYAGEDKEFVNANDHAYASEGEMLTSVLKKKPGHWLPPASEPKPEQPEFPGSLLDLLG